MSREEYRRNCDRKLTEVQENRLVKHINVLTERGNAPTYAMVRRFAEELSKKSMGKNWPHKFVKRNNKKLSTGYLDAIEMSRKKADSARSYQRWFDQVMQSKLWRYGCSNCHNIGVRCHRQIRHPAFKYL